MAIVPILELIPTEGKTKLKKAIIEMEKIEIISSFLNMVVYPLFVFEKNKAWLQNLECQAFSLSFHHFSSPSLSQEKVVKS
jgi:hypothetical protein